MSLSKQIITSVFLIVVLGLIMIFTASSAEALDLLLPNTKHALLKQCFYALMSTGFAYIFFRVGYKRVYENSFAIIVFFSILLLLVFMPGIGISANGSRRWLGIGGWSIQPSEFVKYIVPLVFLKQLFSLKPGFSFRDFCIASLPVGIPIVLIFLEPNNGTVGVIGASCAIVCFLTKVPLKFWAIPLVVLSGLLVVCAIKMPYVQGRIYVYLHPEADLKGKGHQPYQAKIASGSGGLFGKGPGKSIQKLSYLPEAQNDYIAAIFAEEYGFFGICLLISLYAWLGIAGYAVAMKALTEEERFGAAVITFLITFQAFMNMGVVSGLLPSTGLNLPFFSQGGSSLIAHMLAIGMLVCIAEHSKENKIAYV